MNFSDKIVDHFLHPRNMGVIAESAVEKNSEQLLIADAGQITRGDALRLYLRVRKSDETILEARFQNFGTGMPIASASYVCEKLPGQTLSAALRITGEDLDRALDGLPELKNRQPILILNAIDIAVRTFRGQPLLEKGQKGEPPICFCFQVPISVVERAVRLRGLDSVDEISAVTRAGAGCHTCHPDLEYILDRCRRREYTVHIPLADYESAHRTYARPMPSPEELAANPAPPQPERTARTAPDGFIYPDKSPVAEVVGNRSASKFKPSKPWPEMNADERLKRIEDVLEYDLRPAIRTDGGDIKLVKLEDNKVFVTLHGHCKSCHSATSTLKFGVEKRLQEAVWPELEVEEVFTF